MSLSKSEQNELKERLKSQRRERHIKEPKNRISLDRGVTKLSELTRSDRKYIENLYVDLSKDISDEMRRLSITPQTNTVKLEKFRLTQLQKSVDRELAHIRDETQTRIMSSMTMAAQSVSQSNVDWLTSMGLKFYHTPAAVPADVIANLVSGRVYANNWEFSKAIWGDYRQSKGDLANIIAKGVAAGKSAYDIAVDLQTYVSPKAAKPWDWSKVYPYSKKKIDYNAQRLARTMVAHAYQQSVIETSKANPFVYTVQWRSAMEHNRTCLICEQRNGNIYPLDSVPMDHPNGLCTIFPVIQGSLKDVAGQLADWVNGSADERFDKKMDSYIDYLGFDPQKIRALTLAAGSLTRSVFSVGAGLASNDSEKTYSDQHFIAGGLAFNKVSGEKPISKALKQELSDEYDRFTQVFGDIDTVTAVEAAAYENDGIYGSYNDNSGIIELRGAGGDNGKWFMQTVAKEMKKQGKWSTASPFHQFRHELTHGLQKFNKENDSDYYKKLSKIEAIKKKIWSDLTFAENSGNMDMAKEKARILSTYGLQTKGDTDEFISECVAEYLNGKPRETAKKVVDILLGKDEE